jgi:tetratricopeptide (TPR) repeat protein
MTQDGPGQALTPEAWERIGDIFSQAVELDEPERSAFVDQACEGNPHFRTEIVALLGHHNEPAFVDRPSPAAAALNSALGGATGPSLAEGHVLAGRYRIEALLGTGGMGEVHRALDTASGERVAVKVLRPELAVNPSLLRRFQREVPLARRASHAHICPVYDVGVDGTVHYFTMKLVAGETLAQRIRRTGPLSKDEAFPLIVQMAVGLAAAHRAGVIHRDFKCSNVMLSPEGAVITDFGLARFEARPNADGTASTPASLISALAPGTITANAQVAGTVAYMSPEQLSGGDVTAASDIYSLGVVLYEMATGGLPFSDSHIIQSAMQRVSGPAPDVRQVAPDLDARWSTAITRCLQRKPGDRFASAEAVAHHIAPSGWRPAMAYWTRRQWTVAAAVAVVAALAMGGGWYALTRPYQPKVEALTWYRQGVQFFHDGSVESARRALEQAVESDSNYASAHTYLAAAYNDLDYRELARQEIARALELEKTVRITTVDALRSKAVGFLIDRQFDSARASIAQLQSASNPADLSADLLDRAWIEARAVANAAAEGTLQQVLVREPRNAGAHYRLGRIYAVQRKTPNALESLDRAEQLFAAASNYDGVCETLLQRTLLLARSDKATEAAATADRALTIARSTQDQNHEVRLLLAQGLAFANLGRVADAEKATNAALVIAQQRKMDANATTVGVLDLGNFHFQRGEPELAERYYRQGLEFAERNGSAYNQARAELSLVSLFVQYARPSEAAGLVGSAREYFARAGMRRESLQATLLAGRIAQGLADFPAAEASYRDVIKQAIAAADSEQEALARDTLSEVLYARGDWQHALEERESFIAKAGSSRGGLRRVSGLVDLARLHSAAGRFEDANKAVDQAALTLPKLQGDLVQLRARLGVAAAEIAYRQAEWGRALGSAVIASKLAPKASAEFIEAAGFSCLARMRLGRTGAENECARLLETPTTKSNPALAATLGLYFAEALRGAGQRAAASAQAKSVLQFFRAHQLPEQLWRCEALAEPGRAAGTLKGLIDSWPVGVARTYLARPDLKAKTFLTVSNTVSAYLVEKAF